MTGTRRDSGRSPALGGSILSAVFGGAVAIGAFLTVQSVSQPPLSAIDVAIGFTGVALMALGALIFVIGVVATIKFWHHSPDDTLEDNGD